MSIRPNKDRKGNILPRSWIIDYYPQGRKGKRVQQVANDMTEGEAWELESQIRRQYGSAIPLHGKVIDALPGWLAAGRNNYAASTYLDIQNCLKKLSPHFGQKLWTALNQPLIEKYKTARLQDGVGKRTINKELTWFSSLWKWAAAHGHCNQPPFRIPVFPKVRRPQIRVPSMDEVQAVIDNIEERYRPILLLYYDLGLRREEALQIKGEDIWLNSREVCVIGKGNKEKILPITTPRLFEVLKTAKLQHPLGYLFRNPKNNGKPYHSIRKAIIRAAEKAGIDQRVYAHLFRHSFVTHGIECGVEITALQTIARHSDIRTTREYIHLRNQHLRNEVTKMPGYTSQPVEEITPREDK
jgi:site-specific recombinase XerD